MTYISELSRILSQRLNWHKSRIECFSQMLLALFVVRSVNLSESGAGLGISTQPDYTAMIESLANTRSTLAWQGILLSKLKDLKAEVFGFNIDDDEYETFLTRALNNKHPLPNIYFSNIKNRNVILSE